MGLQLHNFNITDEFKQGQKSHDIPEEDTKLNKFFFHKRFGARHSQINSTSKYPWSRARVMHECNGRRLTNPTGTTHQEVPSVWWFKYLLCQWWELGFVIRPDIHIWTIIHVHHIESTTWTHICLVSYWQDTIDHALLWYEPFMFFSILYQIHWIRWISWIQLESVNHDYRMVKDFLCLSLTTCSFSTMVSMPDWWSVVWGFKAHRSLFLNDNFFLI